MAATTVAAAAASSVISGWRGAAAGRCACVAFMAAAAEHGMAAKRRVGMADDGIGDKTA